MSSTVSLTTTATSSAGASSTSACTPSWTIPTTDAACAIQVSGNGSAVMKQCCGVASVVDYNNGCTEYCLAQDQDVGDLTKCLYSNGVTYNDVFCNNGTNATATAAVSSASSTSTTTGTATKSGASSTSTGAAAKMSTGGVGVLALLFCSAMFGALA